MVVIKRDGREVAFCGEKIFNAIIKAARAIEKPVELVEETASRISREIESQNKTLSVEEIQDMVEKKLMASSLKDVAKSYINYRYLHSMARSQYNDLMKAIAEKIEALDVQNQNANVDEHSFGGRVGEASDIVMKQYALDYCVSPMARENHLNNEIYIHDLNSYAVGSHNCLSIPFDKLLANGFNTRQTDVRPAQSINTAFQLIAVIFQIQSLQQFGGVSATHLDWTMVPYVRKSFYKHYKNAVLYIADCCDMDKDYILRELEDSMPIDSEEYAKYPKLYKYAMDMTVKETYQAVEGMYHNLK